MYSNVFYFFPFLLRRINANSDVIEVYGKIIVKETRKPFLFCSIVTFAVSMVLSRQRNRSGRKRPAGTTEDTILVFWKRSRVIVRDNRAFRGTARVFGRY